MEEVILQFVRENGGTVHENELVNSIDGLTRLEIVQACQSLEEQGLLSHDGAYYSVVA